MRPKGSPRTPGSGRKKGTPNKTVTSLREMAESLGVDPFKVLLHFAKGDWEALGYENRTYTKYTQFGPNEFDYIEPSVRAKAAAEACQYLHPKLKQVETTVKESPEPDPNLKNFTSEELAEMYKIQEAAKKRALDVS